jgi:hypothetical protein
MLARLNGPQSNIARQGISRVMVDMQAAKVLRAVAGHTLTAIL